MWDFCSFGDIEVLLHSDMPTLKNYITMNILPLVMTVYHFVCCHMGLKF